MRISTYTILAVFTLSCNSINITEEDINYVKANTWQWDKGIKIGEGDFVSFDKGSKVFFLIDKTIYFNKQPKALIKKVDKKNYEMTISSLDSKETGLYINIEEFTK